MSKIYVEKDKILDGDNIITVNTKEYGNIDVVPVDTINDIEGIEDIVIPPVKVGQTLYYIKGYYYNSSILTPTPITVTEISQKYCGKRPDNKRLEWAFIANGTRYKFSSIGKIIFYNIEDAQKFCEKQKKGVR